VCVCVSVCVCVCVQRHHTKHLTSRISIRKTPTGLDYKYNETCEDCHPCKSATCHSWLCFYRTGKFL